MKYFILILSLFMVPLAQASCFPGYPCGASCDSYQFLDEDEAPDGVPILRIKTRPTATTPGSVFTVQYPSIAQRELVDSCHDVTRDGYINQHAYFWFKDAGGNYIWDTGGGEDIYFDILEADKNSVFPGVTNNLQVYYVEAHRSIVKYCYRDDSRRQQIFQCKNPLVNNEFLESEEGQETIGSIMSIISSMEWDVGQKTTGTMADVKSYKLNTAIQY